MILAALTVAAALTGATPAVDILPTPNLYRQPAGCADIQRRVLEDQQEKPSFKLARQPPGHLEYAVLRTVGGCPVPAPVGYHPPSLPGAADAPAMRGDAPSNRR
jgi:hypothetical protein